MTKQVIYDGESQSYNQVQRPNVRVNGSKEHPKEFNTNFIEGSPFGSYNGKGDSQGGRKKKS